MPKIHTVPTNIITGFLGVGKTTAILHLLKHKRQHERWAVLVNEFGEIGIDGGLIAGMQSQNSGIFIQEVPGGCMCCTSGVPMQVALNRLLSEAKPDRLIIEPTGLGHPKEVVAVLSAEHYQTVLQLNATLTLVDARKIIDTRYTQHDIFNQQLEVADVIVGNKMDLYPANAQQNLLAYLSNHTQLTHKPVYFVANGQIDATWLQRPFQRKLPQVIHGEAHAHQHHATMLNVLPTDTTSFPECGYLKVANQGEGFQSVGLQFKPDVIFQRQKIVALLANLTVERAKAVFITSEGVFGYNKTQDQLTEVELNLSVDSRIEIIAFEIQNDLEKAVLACV